MLDNGISVYGFNIPLTISPYDYLDFEGLAGRVIAGAFGDMVWLTQRLRHKTDSEHGLLDLSNSSMCHSESCVRLREMPPKRLPQTFVISDHAASRLSKSDA